METRGESRFAAAGDPEVDVSSQAAILIALRAGVMTREEACQRYFISEEELVRWEMAFDRVGIPGLRVATLHFYRRAAGLDSVIPSRPQTITALSSEIPQDGSGNDQV